MGFNDIVLKALSDITGITVDLTTVCVGIIVIVVILCGLDFLKDVLLDRAHGGSSGSSEKYGDNPNFAAENQEKYNKYARNRYWKEQHKSRYENEYKR